MRTLRAAALAALLLLPPLRARAEELGLKEYQASVVQVFTTAQASDYVMPWQAPEAEDFTGSAFFIGSERLMTNAHVVSDSKNLLVKRADRADRIQARVLFVAHDCDLAILTVDDPKFFEGMTELSFGPQPGIRSKVAAIGYPMGGKKLSFTEGVVSRIELQTYSHSGADEHLAIQIDAAINPGNSGGPVVQDGKVVGVAFQGQFFSQNIGYMIPPSVIQHFLEDVKDGRYDGYPELGLVTSNLENAPLRAYLGVPEGATGVVVLKALPYASCEGLLRRNDVLHSIDGIPILDDGTIDLSGELLDFSLVVENKQVGSSVKLGIRREGRQMEIEVPLKRWDAPMSMAQIHDRRAEYRVIGGYVFLPLTSNYLWQAGRASEEMSFYMQQYYQLIAGENEPREQLVLLSQVLRHPTTKYTAGAYVNAIVEKVNGRSPWDFRHFVELLEDPSAEVVKIEFEGVNVPPVLLDRKAVAAAHEEILRAYNVSEDRYVEGR